MLLQLIRSADIKTAFLNSEVNRDIYLGVPEGFEKIFPGAKVLKVNKAIYGAVDSPLRFFLTIYSTLQQFVGPDPNSELIQNQADICSFTYLVNNQLHGCLGIHCDDFYITGTQSFLTAFCEFLGTHYTIKVKTNPQKFLGCDLSYTNGSILLNQRSFIDKLISKLGWNPDNIRPAYSPAPLAIPADWKQADYASKNVPATDILKLLGALIWLSTRSRPDIAYHVSVYAAMPHTELTLALLRFAIRYVFTTRDQGIIFHHESDCQLSLFTDAALKISTQSGGVVYFGSTPIYWQSVKQQQYVNSSTVNAEMSALHLMSTTYLYIAAIIHYLTAADYSYPYQVFVDNKPLQHRLHGRRQFTEVPDRIPKYYELANWFNEPNQQLKLNHIQGKHNPADLFTKVLSPSTIKLYAKYINLGTLTTRPFNVKSLFQYTDLQA
ncbi:unnamed protein product [Ambrosiozyma monospora]|uniref:Unnamed protein product n=1 Tax=Ambrosiozyma monospora TaxID=43982 RepID=A0A9W6YUZ4_AMBMO|nr:unnamed protein product [Ambrosiozyma monospora]